MYYENLYTRQIIYIIRHGQTEYNSLGLVQGCSIDSDLNDVGIQQTELFFQKHEPTKYLCRFLCFSVER
ncbi:histidine phosphatase family protein [Bernardetia litoralis]|uniref:histidine phosphatase family protein n=1 Tax=Bernardetia litoralis TaxID=999 RepID=UPI0009D952FD